jgi:transcriptional regulator with XRE-family HTH domain
MPRYTHHQLDWARFLDDLSAYKHQQGLSQAQLARLLRISSSALTLYLQRRRQPSVEIFAFAVLLMGRALPDYCTSASR